MNIQSQDYAAVRASETAVVIVNGEKFDNWESVWIQHRWTDPWPIFRFTCAEQLPVPSLWTQMQFEPGDTCTITLGGVQAISGIILSRQTAYDAVNHGVQFQGVGITWLAARASVVDKTSNYDNQNFMQIAKKILQPWAGQIDMVPIGDIPSTPLEHFQVNAGEPIWDIFDRLTRVYGLRLGTDEYGNFLAIGDHVGQSAGVLKEGDNILRCQCVISIEAWFNEIFLRSQQPAHDPVNGPEASEQEVISKGPLRQYSPQVIPSEEPVTIDLLRKRAKNEAIWMAGTRLQAIITVQGWFVPGGSKLWAAGDLVEVDSPMALIVPSFVLAIQTVTFTQDRNSGTLTILELVAPWLLNDLTDKNISNPNMPQPPDGTTTVNPGAPLTPQDIQIEEQRP